MAKFMMVYKGEATDMADMTEEQQGEILAKWGAWIQKVGDSMADVGAPFGPNASLIDDGSAGQATSLSGYSIVEADDLEGAKALADGHPYLSESTGDYAIDIYELMPVPM